MKINFFVCSNGLGHLNRCSKLAVQLKKIYKINVLLFCSKKGFEALGLDKCFDSSEIFFVENKMLAGGGSFNGNYWKKIFLEYVDKSDICISDNLADFLIFERKFLLISNFFWHEVINVNHTHYAKMQKLLLAVQPPILGHHIYAMPSIRKSNNFYGYGYNFEINKRNSSIDKKGLLIASGASKRAEKVFMDNVDYILETAKNFPLIYLDNYLLEQFGDLLGAFETADFSNKMFDSLKYAIVRPGLGTLENLYLNAIPFKAIYEPENLEMDYLYNTTKKMGLCIEYDELETFDKRCLDKYLSYENDQFDLTEVVYSVLKHLRS